MGEEHRVVIPGVQELVPDVCDFVVAAARRANLTERAVYQCQMAVDEACTNIIEHGFSKAGEPGQIEVICQDSEDAYTITILDDSPPFNPLERIDPDTNAPLAEREPGGWGIYFIKKMMDAADYTLENGRNKLTIYKRKTPENVNPSPVKPAAQTVGIDHIAANLWQVTPTARLDSNTAPALEAALENEIASGHVQILLNMSVVTYISTSGLKVLVNAWRRAQTSGGAVVLVGLTPNVAEVFETVGFDQVFDIYSTIDDAVRSLSNETA